MDDRRRTASDEDKVLVLDEINSFRDLLYFSVPDVALVDMSGRTMIFNEVDVVCLDAYELISIDSQAPLMTNENVRPAASVR